MGRSRSRSRSPSSRNRHRRHRRDRRSRSRSRSRYSRHRSSRDIKNDRKTRFICILVNYHNNCKIYVYYYF